MNIFSIKGLMEVVLPRNLYYRLSLVKQLLKTGKHYKAVS